MVQDSWPVYEQKGFIKGLQCACGLHTKETFVLEEVRSGDRVSFRTLYDKHQAIERVNYLSGAHGPGSNQNGTGLPC